MDGCTSKWMERVDRAGEVKGRCSTYQQTTSPKKRRGKKKMVKWSNAPEASPVEQVCATHGVTSCLMASLPVVHWHEISVSEQPELPIAVTKQPYYVRKRKKRSVLEGSICWGDFLGGWLLLYMEDEGGGEGGGGRTAQLGMPVISCA